MQEDYIAVIDALSAGIRAQPDLQVVTNAMSTQDLRRLRAGVRGNQ